MQTLYSGMCVGSHGWVHESHATSPRWKESIASSSKLIHDTLPEAYVPAFRPPYGQRLPDSGTYLKAQGVKLILWNIDSHDWDDSLKIAEVEQRTMSLMLLWRRGIVLFHDFFPRAQKVVPRLVAWLANDGAARTGGLKAGQWVTTGSWTGLSLGIACSEVDVTFSSAGKVNLRFE